MYIYSETTSPLSISASSGARGDGRGRLERGGGGRRMSLSRRAVWLYNIYTYILYIYLCIYIGGMRTSSSMRTVWLGYAKVSNAI
jgi:hypothetical protein